MCSFLFAYEDLYVLSENWKKVLSNVVVIFLKKQFLKHFLIYFENGSPVLRRICEQ